MGLANVSLEMVLYWLPVETGCYKAILRDLEHAFSVKVHKGNVAARKTGRTY